MRLLSWWHDRLTRVQIEQRDALECIRYWDSPDTVFYLDPPYVRSTRAKGKRNVYRRECGDEHHAALVELLLSIRGRALVSGYDHAIYQPLAAAGWRKHQFRTSCHAAGRGRGGPIRGAGSATAHVPRIETAWVKES